ncbi:glycosyl hydrolase [Pedobacter sp. SYSU D00535]|uniref:glycosyl hydrolase n=1 Tax=Pedobacter sp. SYSU D00535 TaxID=2810308 RepID=UPI001A9604C6|nr:glycosyl hydrolase [Pedobacter sp. SYSU D00535]
MKVQNLKSLLLGFLFFQMLLVGCQKEETSDAEQLNESISAKPGGGTTTPPLSGPILEAEKGTLAGGAVAVADANRSGGFFVEQNSGSISFQVSIPADGYYNVYLNAASPHGEKTNIVAIDGVSSNFTTPFNTAYVDYKVVNSFKLTAGTHTIAINNSWGYIQVDFLRLEEIDPASRFNINTSLVTVGATAQANNVYQFLRNNYGKKILSGVMTLNSFDETNWLKQNTGKEPAIMGLDFMHANRGYTWYDDRTSIRDAKTWWDRNGIPVYVWHWRDPSRQTEEFYADKTTFDVSKIFSPGSPEYNAMMSDIDHISGLLKELQSQNVPVIWRPLHEAAGGWFWWGAKGPEACKKLYQVMYDRMVNYHGLKNMIWVWTREPNDDAWYPGDSYVDIVGRDIYKQGDHTSQSIEFNNMNALYGGKKMVAITECGSNPDPDNLVADAAGWSWFMTWYGDYTRQRTHNSLTIWRKIMNHSYVITLDEMPSLK